MSKKDEKKRFKESDRYETPSHVYQALNETYGPFDLDACAEKKTAKCSNWYGPDHPTPTARDSLKIQWHCFGNKVFMNPPYSEPRTWVLKAIEESKKGTTVVALLPADTSTKWFHELIKNNPRCHYEFMKGRINFLKNGKKNNAAKFGSMIAVFF